ncbi:MAG: TMEM165/GDT1 family protein [Lysobacterales bacterium]
MEAFFVSERAKHKEIFRQVNLPEEFIVTSSSFALIALAEIGDKSQLVCMTLATRHRPLPILMGAATAFAVLNLLAVMFGAVVAAWMPDRAMSGVAAVLFGLFGVHALLSGNKSEPEDEMNNSVANLFFATLFLILVAEFGDKTQISVAALAGSLPHLQVWLGATMGLVTVSSLGVWAGRTVLQRVPVHWVRRGSGLMFLTFALIACWHAIA